MISIKENKDEIVISGHANYEDYGKDIVCASISSIAITTVNAIVEFDKELRIKLNEEWTPLYSGGESYYRTSNYYPIDKDMNQIGDKKYPVTFNLLSFDALWKDAKLRNETFLKILRDSIIKYSEKMTNK